MANLWLTGEGEPTLAVGTTSDYYRDTVTNIVYYRENNTSWVSVPAFIPNPDGVGTTWLHGSLPPVPEEGSDGDYYYGDVDNIVYRKTGLDWIAKGSLDFIGVYGVQWGNGLGAPANTAPLNNLPAGSFYLDVESSDIYFKPPSMVWELKGQLGAGAGSTTIVVENELDSDSEVNAASVHLAGLVLQEAKDYADNLTPQGVVLSVNGLFPDEGLISLSYADVGADEAGAAATAEQAAKDYADTKQPSDDTLTALSAYDTNGFLVQTAANTFEGRTLTGTSGEITVVNGNGVSGNPTISLPNSGVTSAVYGSGTRIPVVTVNAKGVLTLASDTLITPTFADNLFRIQDNADATKQLALEMGAVSSGTTKTWTAPNVDINFGNLSFVATTDSNVLSGTRTRILGGTANTVSGTDNATVNCTGAVIGGSATKVTAINCTTVNVTQALTRAFLAGCKNVSITSATPSNDGLVALGVAFKTDGIFEFPQWAGHTILGTEDGIRSYITVLGSNTAAGNVNLSSSTGVKPLAALDHLNYRRGIQHIIHLVGQDFSNSPTKVVTVAYKVVGSVTSSGFSLGAVQTIEALFSAVGTPATPTVTISITATDKLNINVASADAMIWAAHVDSYFA